MLIDVTKPILDYAGEPILIDSPTGPKTLTFREAAFQALNSVLEGENPAPAEKETIYSLTMKLYSEPAVDLTIEEAAFLKDRSGKVMSPLVHGRLVEALEGANQLKVLEG
jgi:hypothetical protein